MSKTVVDAADMVNAIRGLLKRWAVDGKVEHKIRDHQKGLIDFRFTSHENMGYEMTVDFNDFMRSPNKYLDKMMSDIVSQTSAARERRQRESRIVIANYGTAH